MIFICNILCLYTCENIYLIFWIHYHIQEYGSGSVFVWKVFLLKKIVYFFFFFFFGILESPLDCKEDKPVKPKGIWSWIFIGRTDAETATAILWPPDAKNWLIGKDPDSGKDWRQEKGTTEDEMVGWHYRLNRHEFEQALRVGDGQGSLVCCSPWESKESDMTEQLN